MDPLAWRLVRGAGWGRRQRKKGEEEGEREAEEDDDENWGSGEEPERVTRAGAEAGAPCGARSS